MCVQFGIEYSEVPLLDTGAFDLAAVDAAIAANPAVKVLHVQRSCGYQWRKSIPIAEIERYDTDTICAFIMRCVPMVAPIATSTSNYC
jgi:cystathionine beta-lyase family protein involved in aluminum resistance